MSATLPTSLLVGHIMTDAEWNQLIRGIAAMSNIETFCSRSVSASTASTSYVNISGAVINYMKQYDSSTSDVGILYMGAAHSGTASAVVSFGVNDGTSDHDLSSIPQLSVNKHYYQCGFTKLTGLANGAYTFQLRWKHNTTATNATIDSNDAISLLAIELPK